MEVQNQVDKELLRNVLGLAQYQRTVTTRLIDYLQEIEKRKLYSKTKHSSLYQFCSEFLKISEGQSYQLSRAASLVEVIPELKSKLASGGVTLTTLSKLDSFCREQQIKKRVTKIELLSEIEGKNSKECQQRLMELTPPERVPGREIISAVSPAHKRINITLENETVDRLGRVRNLLAHKGVSSYGQAVDFMTRITLSKIDRTQMRTIKRVSHNENPRQIPESTKKFVWQRANGVCENCGSDFALEIDHIRPIAKGGGKEISNLRLLCRSCNKRSAIECFGRDAVRATPA